MNVNLPAVDEYAAAKEALTEPVQRFIHAALAMCPDMPVGVVVMLACDAFRGLAEDVVKEKAALHDSQRGTYQGQYLG